MMMVCCYAIGCNCYILSWNQLKFMNLEFSDASWCVQRIWCFWVCLVLFEIEPGKNLELECNVALLLVDHGFGPGMLMVTG